MIRKHIFSIVTALVILYFSLTGSKTFNPISFINIPYIDKLGHLGAYFLLMMVIIIEHRNYFRNTRQLLLVALIPFFFGIVLEFLQFLTTTNRKAEVLDAIFNSAGVTIALFLWLFYKPFYSENIR